VKLVVKKADTENFCEPDSPCFEAAYAKPATGFSGTLKVVCWNIMFSQEIATAIDELGGQPDLNGADVILLQEMDETGVEAIAAALELNYVYYPASVHGRTGRMFGNAVLARWPIVGTKKLLLPHMSPRTGEVRVATRAHIKIEDHDILTYSVHTETYALGKEKRHEQFRTLVDDIEKESHHHVLVGGDFNTLTAGNLSRLDQRFSRVSLGRAPLGARGTVKPGALGINADHIFTRGLASDDGGVFRKTKASDHFPVWQQLKLESCPE
jgi:endonuclease/exonuclease/phosphatase family metal-dependent hydrolase